MEGPLGQRVRHCVCVTPVDCQSVGPFEADVALPARPRRKLYGIAALWPVVARLRGRGDGRADFSRCTSVGISLPHPA